MDNKVISAPVDPTQRVWGSAFDYPVFKMYRAVVFDPLQGTFSVPVFVKATIAHGGSRVYAFVRVDVYPGQASYYGVGKAGGYGYCKLSSAIGSAIRSAGIQLEHPIDGVGESAVDGAIRALTEWALHGKPYPFTVV